MNNYHCNVKENPIINISFNIIIPSIIMTKFDDWFELNPTVALIIALSFPLGYGIYDFIINHKYNIFSTIGFFSILITGSIGLLKLPSQWIPIKEAVIPLIFSIIVIISMYGKKTLLEKFLFAENLLDGDLIYSHITTEEQKNIFQKIMKDATIMLAISFIISSILNFILAKSTIHSASDSVEFTKEVGVMFALSYPVIVLPCTIILYYILHFIMKRLKELTGLSVNEMLNIKD